MSGDLELFPAICHIIIRKNNAQHLVKGFSFSNQSSFDQLEGVNWSKARFTFADCEGFSYWLSVLDNQSSSRWSMDIRNAQNPILLSSFKIDSHLYVLISRNFATCIPSHMPPPLQIRTSRIHWSHQHSLKLGKRWVNWTSVISHVIDNVQQIP